MNRFYKSIISMVRDSLAHKVNSELHYKTVTITNVFNNKEYDTTDGRANSLNNAMFDEGDSALLIKTADKRKWLYKFYPRVTKQPEHKFTVSEKLLSTVKVLFLSIRTYIRSVLFSVDCTEVVQESSSLQYPFFSDGELATEIPVLEDKTAVLNLELSNGPKVKWETAEVSFIESTLLSTTEVLPTIATDTNTIGTLAMPTIATYNRNILACAFVEVYKAGETNEIVVHALSDFSNLGISITIQYADGNISADSLTEEDWQSIGAIAPVTPARTYLEYEYPGDTGGLWYRLLTNFHEVIPNFMGGYIYMQPTVFTDINNPHEEIAIYPIDRVIINKTTGRSSIHKYNPCFLGGKTDRGLFQYTLGWYSCDATNAEIRTKRIEHWCYGGPTLGNVGNILCRLYIHG